MSANERESLPFIHYNKIQNLKRDELCTLKASEYFKDVSVYYIHGLSGTGKTKYAINAIMELYKQKKIETDEFNEVKYCGSFWNGVSIDNMKEVALYDDFRDYHISPSEFINFIDYNVHIMNIKYGFVMNKFKYIFITSIQSPYDLFKKKESNLFAKMRGESEDDSEPEESRIQWLRRINEIVHVNGDGFKVEVNKKIRPQSDK